MTFNIETGLMLMFFFSKAFHLLTHYYCISYCKYNNSLSPHLDICLYSLKEHSQYAVCLQCDFLNKITLSNTNLNCNLYTYQKVCILAVTIREKNVKYLHQYAKQLQTLKVQQVESGVIYTNRPQANRLTSTQHGGNV